MATEILEPTTFSLDENDPLAPAHRLTHDYLVRIPAHAFEGVGSVHTDWAVIRSLHEEAATPVLLLSTAEQLDCIRACGRFSYWSRFEWGWAADKPETVLQRGYEFALSDLCRCILSFEREWSSKEIEAIVEIAVPYNFQKTEIISSLVEHHLQQHEITDSLRARATVVREWNARVSHLARWLSLGAVLGEPLVLHRGEKWADDAASFIFQQPESLRELWRLLLLGCVDSDKNKPSQKWIKEARSHIVEIGLGVFEDCFVRWGGDYGQSTSSYELNQAIFKGLVWCASLSPTEKTASTLSRIALAALRPAASNNTAFSLNLFKACMWSLGQLEHPAALDRLLGLRSQVRGSRLKSVEKALQVIAER